MQRRLPNKEEFPDLRRFEFCISSDYHLADANFIVSDVPRGA